MATPDYAACVAHFILCGWAPMVCTNPFDVRLVNVSRRQNIRASWERDGRSRAALNNWAPGISKWMEVSWDKVSVAYAQAAFEALKQFDEMNHADA